MTRADTGKAESERFVSKVCEEPEKRTVCRKIALVYCNSGREAEALLENRVCECHRSYWFNT